MSDIKKSFNEIALESILFKGQRDWYFCFLKSEKIAHVLALLSDKMTESQKSGFFKVVDEASEIPSRIAYFAAGDIDVQVVLAAVFSLMADIRITASRGSISKENALYIVAEYEQMIEKLGFSAKPSPFVSPQDFEVPELAPLSKPSQEKAGYREKQSLHPVSKPSSPGQISDRSGKILGFVLENKAVSIKEICAIVPELSEKTVQRELVLLIGQGLIKKEGERRWSIYKPA
jgi:predicted HTH transcriptional regulator